MAQNGRDSPAEEAAQRDHVLGEVLVQQRSLQQGAAEAEDPDLALAKMLQSQEQAWLAMAGSSSVLENLPPAAGGEPSAAAAHDDSQAAGAGGGMTDEEVARLLQEEEEREFQQRLLALAGIGPAAAGGGAAEGAAADGGADYASEDEVDPDSLSYEELTALGEAVGTVSRGISQQQLDALPVRQYYEVAGAAAGPEEQCPICRVEYEPEDAVRVMPLCGHYAHPDCVGEWLRRNKTCCICNKEVLEDGKAGAAQPGEGGGQREPASSAAANDGGKRPASNVLAPVGK